MRICQQWCSLVNCIDERELETVYKILIRFVSEDTPLPDEEEAIQESEGEYERNDYVTPDEAFT